MTSLIQLPDIIFTLIQTFLSYDDYHYFLNTSKLHFSHLKRRTIVFRLTERRSLQYMEDKEFQGLLLSKVEDGWKQIRLTWQQFHFFRTYDVSVPHDSSYFDPGLERLNVMDRMVMEVIPPLSPQVTELKLTSFTKLRDVSNLSNLTKLIINTSPFLEDISPLENIADLTFHSCMTLSDFSIFTGKKMLRFELDGSPKLSNVSVFKNVRILVLRLLDNIQDISSLSHVYDLTIQYCPKVNDIRGLGGHHHLEISFCDKNLIGYESLFGIPHVKLAGCNISDISVLREAKSVEFQSCWSLKDYEPLKNARKVSIYQTEQFLNLNALCNVFDLSLSTFSAMKRMTLLDLRNHNLTIDFPGIDEDGVKSTSFLSFTKSLTISSFHFPQATLTELTPTLKHLQSLTIQNSEVIIEIKGLEDIPTVKLINLPSVSDISGLGRNHNVELRYCPKIKDVSNLANVQCITIKQCKGISDYSILSKVPRLKVD